MVYDPYLMGDSPAYPLVVYSDAITGTKKLIELLSYDLRINKDITKGCHKELNRQPF